MREGERSNTKSQSKSLRDLHTRQPSWTTKFPLKLRDEFMLPNSTTNHLLQQTQGPKPRMAGSPTAPQPKTPTPPTTYPIPAKCPTFTTFTRRKNLPNLDKRERKPQHFCTPTMRHIAIPNTAQITS
jgi:hypothetical protein